MLVKNVHTPEIELENTDTLELETIQSTFSHAIRILLVKINKLNFQDFFPLLVLSDGKEGIINSKSPSNSTNIVLTILKALVPLLRITI